MSYGFLSNNTAGNTLIDDGFKTLRLYAKVAINASTPYANVPYISGQNYVVAGVNQFKIAFGWRTTDGTNYTSDPGYMAISAVKNSIFDSPTPAIATDFAYIFTDGPATSTPSHGLQIFNSAGVEIYNSDFHALDVISTLTIPITNYDGTFSYTVNNPEGFDYIFAMLWGGSGLWAGNSMLHTSYLYKVNNSTMGQMWASNSWDYSDSAINDRRHITYLPIFKRPLI